MDTLRTSSQKRHRTGIAVALWGATLIAAGAFWATTTAQQADQAPEEPGAVGRIGSVFEVAQYHDQGAALAAADATATREIFAATVVLRGFELAAISIHNHATSSGPGAWFELVILDYTTPKDDDGARIVLTQLGGNLKLGNTLVERRSDGNATLMQAADLEGGAGLLLVTPQGNFMLEAWGENLPPVADLEEMLWSIHR